MDMACSTRCRIGEAMELFRQEWEERRADVLPTRRSVNEREAGSNDGGPHGTVISRYDTPVR